MAGYVWPATTYRLEFADGRAAGLEVHCRAGSVAQFEAIAAQGDLAEANPDQAMAAITETFALSLDSWNLERPVDPRDPAAGTVPVPPTLEGLKSQEPELVQLIVGTWCDAVLARKRQREASAEDREIADALAEFTHEIA